MGDSCSSSYWKWCGGAGGATKRRTTENQRPEWATPTDNGELRQRSFEKKDPVFKEKTKTSFARTKASNGEGERKLRSEQENSV